ncbi:hypothetical protein FH972_010445 [Carpinus fangiana]|uniref:Uncharacterized protein n=1 Tax=Carpinus fangiana TaxID=176857 RepID=A0A660KND2_9ROSI|nr:hypothetical protein FH972_010445 [Carpinus fangiana]
MVVTARTQEGLEEWGYVEVRPVKYSNILTSTWLQKADLLFVAEEHQNSTYDEVVVKKPTTGTGIIFDPSSLGSIVVSRRLDLSLFLSSNKTQAKSLLPCSLFMAKERQKPAMEEMVLQKYIT